jgi:DNA-binding CsgD family transcriptional regulator
MTKGLREEIALILADPCPSPDLTPREHEALRLAARGLTIPQIAEVMDISAGNVTQAIWTGLKRIGLTHKHQLTQRMVKRIEQALR